MITFELPFPTCSANNMKFRKRGENRLILTQEYRTYLDRARGVCFVVMRKNGWRHLGGRLGVTIEFRAPCHRRRDLDNFTKPVLDAMSGTIFDDDSQIDDLHLIRGPTGEGVVRVEVRKL